MAIALVSSVGAAPFFNGGTTAAINTTGATLLVISVSWNTNGSPSTVADSKGNVYTPTTTHVSVDCAHRFYYCIGTPVVGSGHTFTVTGSFFYPAFIAYAFSGALGNTGFESGTNATSVTSLASGSVTPTENGALILTADSGQTAVTDSISTPGFTLTSFPAGGGNNVQGSAAYYIQPTIAAINPTWGFSPTQARVALSTIVFQPSEIAAANVRATQLVNDVLTKPVSIQARSTQVAIEVLTKNVLEKIKVTPPHRGNATTTTVTFTPAPVLNNGIVILVHGYDASSGATFGPSACTDNQGNTYVLAITRQNVGEKNAVAIYYCSQVTFTGTPFNISITFSAATYFTTVGAEIAGPIALDGTASNTGNATAVTTGTTAALTANDQLVTAIQSVTGGSESSIVVQSVSPAWFEEFEDLTWGSHLVGEADSRVISTGLGVGQACAWTNATARPYAAAIATFRIPVVVSTTPVDDVQFLIIG